MSELTDAMDDTAPHGYRNHCAACQVAAFGYVAWPSLIPPRPDLAEPR